MARRLHRGEQGDYDGARAQHDLLIIYTPRTSMHALVFTLFNLQFHTYTT